jgi:hypothetical protein
MNLTNLFASHEQQLKPLFFAIHISELHVQSALWRVEEGQVELVSQSTQHAWKDDESCITAVDQSLQELGKDSEHVSQSLFALNTEWVNADGIIAARKPLFQKITKELQLEAIGFVVTTEAVVQHLAQNVSPQLSLFLIELSVQSMIVSLVRQGQIVRSEKVGRSGDAVSDLTEAFAHFEEKTFPTKMMLFSVVLSDAELQDVRQQLFSHDWPSVYPFLHPPIIEIFSSMNLMELIVKTGGSAVAEAKGLLSPTAASRTTQSTPEPATPAAPLIPAVKEEEESIETFSSTESLPPPLDEYETDHKDEVEDTAEEEPVPEEEKEEETLTAVPVSTASSFGVPIMPKQVEELIEDEAWHEAEIEKEMPHHTTQSTTPSIPPVAGIAAGVIVGIIVLLLVAMSAAHSSVKAFVSVLVNPKTITKEVTLTLDPKAQVSDPNRLVLRAEPITKEMSGEKTIDTTGTKVIGEKAKGQVTLYNYTTNQKTFNTGTKLASGKLNFVLDTAVTLASASTSLDSSGNKLTKPGTGDVAVTAVQIGPDSNISSGVQLTIDNFAADTYLAKAKSAFTGGSSRQAQAVSQADKDRVLSALKKELTDQAVQQFKNEGSSGKYILPTGKNKVIKAEYTPDLGKESNTIKLKLTLSIDAVTYQASELRPLATQVLSAEIPAGYQLGTEEPSILSSPGQSASGSGQLVLQTNFSAQALPQFNATQITTQIEGKTEKQAIDLITTQPGVRSVQIERKPKFLTLFAKTLPTQASNIVISVNK